MVGLDPRPPRHDRPAPRKSQHRRDLLRDL